MLKTIFADATTRVMCHTQQYNTHLHTKVLPFYFFYYFPIFKSNFLLVCLCGYSCKESCCKSVPQLFKDIIYQKWNSISNNFPTLVALGCHILPNPWKLCWALSFCNICAFQGYLWFTVWSTDLVLFFYFWSTTLFYSVAV